jgi:putative heme-binding domain-containing protein
MQSILHPSRDIAPQFVTHTIETRDGQVFSGLLIGQSTIEGVTLFMADGRAVLAPPAQIASQGQSKVSLMPEGLADALTVQDFRDLLAFLLSRQ